MSRGWTFFSLRDNSRLESKIRRLQVRHSRPMSAPSRTMRHSNPPQGWAFRRRTISSICRSGSMGGIITWGGIISF